MAKTLVERQMDFRANRKAEGGMRLDVWLPPEEADKLRKMMCWRDKSGPQIILDLIKGAWDDQVSTAAYGDHADAQFEKAILDAIKGDRTKAKIWFLRSAKQGYRGSAIDNNLGILSLLSDDKKAAAREFEKSAAKGNEFALYNRGLLGLAGRGVQGSYPQVAEWFQKSAEQGNTLAQGVLGVLYALGKGVPQNYDKGLEWLCKGMGEDALACENSLAWLLSTFSHDEYGLRNGQLAVSIAEKLVRSNASSEHLETLASAYAEANRFEDAIRIQKKVLLMLQRGRPSIKRNAVIKARERQLTSYIAKKPWRDTSWRFNYCWDFGDIR